jgi:hypothetical protein
MLINRARPYLSMGLDVSTHGAAQLVSEFELHLYFCHSFFMHRPILRSGFSSARQNLGLA